MKRLLIILLGIIAAVQSNGQNPVYKLSNDPSGTLNKDFVVTIEWPANSSYTNVSLDNALVGVLYHDSTTLTRTNVNGPWADDVNVPKSLINTHCGVTNNPDSFEFQHYYLNTTYQFGNRTSGGSDTLFKLTSSKFVTGGKIKLFTNNSSNSLESCMYSLGVKNTGSIDPAYPSITTGHDLQGIGGTLAVPVKMLSFNGEWKDKDAELNWITVMEENNSHFEVQRSFDGLNYTPIGIVESKGLFGNSNEVLEYRFTDPGVRPYVAKDVYYRLRQVDYDGKNEMTGTVVLNIETGIAGLSKVYPVPAREVVNVMVTRKSLDQEVCLLDMTGRVIARKAQVQDQETPLRFDVSHLDRGIYFIRIRQGTKFETKKIVVK